ncbi:MAG: serine hydrolase [Chloroflexi bacterium]|nr:serine hydrolase [Chloroflexota bacterium]
MDAGWRRTRAGLVLLIVLSASLFSAARVSPGEQVERVAASNPSSLVTPSTVIEVSATGGEPAPAEPRTLTPGEDDALRQAVEDALGGDIAHYGVAVRRLGDGAGIEIGAERVFYAASLFKLAVLYETELRAATGDLDLDGPLHLTDADFEEDLGTAGLLDLDGAGAIPIRSALNAMITHSDNATAVALLHLNGGAAIDQTLAGLGLADTSVNTTDLPTTARDMARLMAAIVRGDGVTGAGRDEMRDLLLGQETRSGIPAGIPARVAVGNKTGTWEGATHDVAFVEAPGGTYVIAVLSDRGWDWAPIARVSQAVYEVLSGGG